MTARAADFRDVLRSIQSIGVTFCILPQYSADGTIRDASGLASPTTEALAMTTHLLMMSAAPQPFRPR